MNFPCYMFHRDFGAQRFEDAESFAKMNDGWFDNPEEAAQYPIDKAAHEAEDERLRQEIEQAAKSALTSTEPVDAEKQKLADVLGVKVEDLHKLEITPADAAELLGGAPAAVPLAFDPSSEIRVTVTEEAQ